MTPATEEVIIGLVTLFLSWGGSVFIAGYRWGSVKTRLDIMEAGMVSMATKDQLAGVKEDVAEIKGMFRMTLRESEH